MNGLAGRRPGLADACPCGSGDAYGDCCRPLHHGDLDAPTAERLVRGRYSAYAVGDGGYVVRTWHPRHRPEVVDVADGTEWTGLDVEAVVGGDEGDDEGTVTFRARWRRGGHEGEMRERSRFVRRGGRWTYLDGDPL